MIHQNCHICRSHHRPADLSTSTYLHQKMRYDTLERTWTHKVQDLYYDEMLFSVIDKVKAFIDAIGQTLMAISHATIGWGRGVPSGGIPYLVSSFDSLFNWYQKLIITDLFLNCVLLAPTLILYHGGVKGLENFSIKLIKNINHAKSWGPIFMVWTAFRTGYFEYNQRSLAIHVSYRVINHLHNHSPLLGFLNFVAFRHFLPNDFIS